MRKIFLYILVGIFLVSFASASFLAHEQNTDFTISIISNNATQCNLSSINYPNGSNKIFNLQLTQNGREYFSIINENNYSNLGNICHNIICFDGINYEGGSICREITKTGTILETSESLTYFILAFGVLILFALSFYFMVSVEYGNKINDRGAVIKITKLKYVKLSLILLTWVLFTWFLNILIGISDNFVSLTMYYGFFGFIFNIMNSLALPLGIFIIVLSFFEIIKDSNINGNIKKFGSSTT